MAKKFGKCTNIGNCNTADNKKIIEIVEGQDFRCPECSKGLFASANPANSSLPISKILMIAIPVVVVAVILILVAGGRKTNGKSVQNGKTNAMASKESVTPVAQTPNEPCKRQAGVLNRVRNEGRLIVAMEAGSSKPMNYIDNSDRKVGFGYDFAKELANGLGASKMTSVEKDFDELPQLINNSEADIVVAGYIKDPSIPNVLWSDAFLENGLCLIVKAGSAISNANQLGGKKVGLWKGDAPTKEWVIKNIPNAIIDDTHDEEGWLRRIDSGEWDAAIYDYIYAAAEVIDIPSLRIVQFNLMTIEYSIMIPCNNDDLLYAINEQIFRIKKSPFYERIFKKYLDTDRRLVKVSDMSGCTDCYTVQKGETLGLIAQNELGNEQRFKDIFELNKDRLASPHLISVGMKLKMPAR